MKTKQEIFEAMKADIIKRKPAPKPDTKTHIPEEDKFAALVQKLKSKQQ